MEKKEEKSSENQKNNDEDEKFQALKPTKKEEKNEFEEPPRKIKHVNPEKQAEDDDDRKSDESFEVEPNESSSEEENLSEDSLDPEDENEEYKEIDMAAYFRFREQEMAKERAEGKIPKSRKRIIAPKPEEKEEEKKPENLEEKKEIKFHFEPLNEYSYLCAYFEAPFTVRGKLYKTIQHYYQAQKFIGEEYKEFAEKIINSKNAFEAKKLALEFSKKITDEAYWKEWDSERKVDAMRRAIKEKFEQHPELKKKLIETGNCDLIEFENFNNYWYFARKRMKK